MSLADIGAYNAMALQGTRARVILADDPSNPVLTTVIMRYGLGEAHSPNSLAREQCRITTHKEFDLTADDKIELLNDDDEIIETLLITTPGQINAALRTHLAVINGED
jgi:hypothetical protein